MGELLLSNRIKEELNIEEKARTNGEKNLPAPEEVELDNVQREIIEATTEAVNQKRNKIKKELESKSEYRFDLQLKIEKVSDLDLILDDIHNNFQTYFSKFKGGIEDKFNTLRQSQRHFIAFKDRNNLKRQADYPESKLLHFSIIAILVVVETILNANMFSVGSRTGLLGGLFNALLVSVINVSAGVITGYFIMPKLNHIRKNVRLKAWAFMILYVIVIPISFNLLVAHFRAQLEANYQEAVILGVQSFFSNPINIQNVNSWVLFAFGCIVSIIACFDGYKLDDPYPKYGHVTRLYNKFKKEYMDFKKEFYDSLNNIVSTGRQTLNSNIIDFNKSLSLYEDSIISSEEMLNNFNENYLEVATEALITNINIYRQKNSLVRDKPRPEYFDDDVEIDFKCDKKLTDPSIATSIQYLEEKKKILSKIGEQKSTLSNKISELRKDLKGELDEYFNQLEKNADKGLLGNEA